MHDVYSLALVHHHHHHHHHIANKQLCHLLTHSGPTHLELSLMISPGFFCVWYVLFLFSSAIFYEAFFYKLRTISSVFLCFVQSWCYV